jgi:hypothetical protein
LQALNIILVYSKAILKEIFVFIKQETSEKSVMPEDPAKDLNFREPLIDSLRAEKDDVSQIYIPHDDISNFYTTQFTCLKKENE